MRYLTIFIVLALWLGGCSATIMKLFYKTGVVADDYRYGDLYRLSNLSQFKDPVHRCPNAYGVTKRKNLGVSLYVIGDSFTEPSRLSEQDFPIDHYVRIRWDDQSPVRLDTTRQNILLIETIERNVREHFSKRVTNYSVVDTTTPISISSPASPPNRYLLLTRKIIDFIHAKDIEEQLETILFSHNLFLWFREVKATINLYWFDRVPQSVSLSQDRSHLFVSLDTDTTKHYTSSFAPLPNRELNELIYNLNDTADRYLAAGFDAVYLSIIPNKVSILDPTKGSYNHLIERVEHNPQLRVPVVSVYSIYKKQSASVYALGDSHWSCNGRRIWLEVFKNRAGL